MNESQQVNNKKLLKKTLGKCNSLFKIPKDLEILKVILSMCALKFSSMSIVILSTYVSSSTRLVKCCKTNL